MREAINESRDADTGQHRHRIPLGLVLLAQGWITHPQLQKALELQKESGAGRIGDWLVTECGVKPDWVTRGLSVQWNCPVLTTESFTPEAMALVLPRPFITEFGILPLRVAASTILYIGFQDQLDASAALAVGQMSSLKAESGVIGERRFSAARSLLLECEFAPLIHVVSPDRDMMARSVAIILEKRQPIASRLVRLHKYYWLRIWKDNGRSLKTGSGKGTHDFLFTIEPGK